MEGDFQTWRPSTSDSASQYSSAPVRQLATTPPDQTASTNLAAAFRTNHIISYAPTAAATQFTSSAAGRSTLPLATRTQRHRDQQCSAHAADAAAAAVALPQKRRKVTHVCWGRELERGASACETEHEWIAQDVAGAFREHFCNRCRRQGVAVSTSRIYVVEGDVDTPNARSAGVWNNAKQDQISLVIFSTLPTNFKAMPWPPHRIINQTSECAGPKLAILREVSDERLPGLVPLSDLVEQAKLGATMTFRVGRCVLDASWTRRTAHSPATASRTCSSRCRTLTPTGTVWLKVARDHAPHAGRIPPAAAPAIAVTATQPPPGVPGLPGTPAPPWPALPHFFPGYAGAPPVPMYGSPMWSWPLNAQAWGGAFYGQGRAQHTAAQLAAALEVVNAGAYPRAACSGPCDSGNILSTPAARPPPQGMPPQPMPPQDMPQPMPPQDAAVASGAAVRHEHTLHAPVPQRPFEQLRQPQQQCALGTAPDAWSAPAFVSFSMAPDAWSAPAGLSWHPGAAWPPQLPPGQPLPPGHQRLLSQSLPPGLAPPGLLPPHVSSFSSPGELIHQRALELARTLAAPGLVDGGLAAAPMASQALEAPMASQALEAPMASQALEAVVPDGVLAGQVMQVMTTAGPAGVAIPAGLSAGDRFQFRVQMPSAGGPAAPWPAPGPLPAPALEGKEGGDDDTAASASNSEQEPPGIPKGEGEGGGGGGATSRAGGPPHSTHDSSSE